MLYFNGLRYITGVLIAYIYIEYTYIYIDSLLYTTYIVHNFIKTCDSNMNANTKDTTIDLDKRVTLEKLHTTDTF